jgi:hypothetical protein
MLLGNTQVVPNLFSGLQSGLTRGLLGVCEGASVPDQGIQVQNRFEEGEGPYPPFKKSGAKSVATEIVATGSMC